MEVFEVVLDYDLADAFGAVADGQGEAVLAVGAATDVLDLEVDGGVAALELGDLAADFDGHHAGEFYWDGD